MLQNKPAKWISNRNARLSPISLSVSWHSFQTFRSKNRGPRPFAKNTIVLQSQIVEEKETAKMHSATIIKPIDEIFCVVLKGVIYW